MATFFEDQLKFREWLESNHDRENELIVGYYKVESGKPSMSWRRQKEKKVIALSAQVKS